MNKNTILTIIVIALFAGSGAVLYFGLFKSSGTAPSPIEENQKNIVDLMPYGENLTFDILSKRTDAAPPYLYKKVEPTLDAGHTTRDLMQNLDLGTGSGGTSPTPDLSGRDFLLTR